MRSSRELLARAWGAGAGPRAEPFTIDLDSTICETYGLAKEGALHHGYTGVRGYHPLLAVAAGTGEVLMARLREGRANTVRGAAPLPDRDDRPGPICRSERRDHDAGRQWLLCPRGRGSLREAWRPLLHHDPSAAQRAPPHRGDPGVCLDPDPVLDARRRGRGRDELHTLCEREGREARPAHRPTGATHPGLPARSLALYDYHAFITDRDGETLVLEADHRRHAEIENASEISSTGWDSITCRRQVAANAAWLAVQVIAHNLARWTARIGLRAGIVTTKTLRRRLFNLLAGSLARLAE